ncbi:MAG: DNA-protecting protein DprA [Gemmatimonadetes bacterium]|nr:DNA-protecting protein DprA [Gemmatimonadota bacterium]
MGDRLRTGPSPGELRARLHLALLPGVGDRRLAELCRTFGSAEAAVAADAEAFRRVAGLRAAEARASPVVRQRLDYGLGVIRERGLSVRVAGYRGYPPALSQLHDPPQLLFLQGNEALLDAPCVAIVGSRHATEYGVRTAAAVAARLAAYGVVVVSGLAFGIDQAAHEGTLDAGGATIAVLGTGPDVTYPSSNRRLMRRIAAEGLLVSEFPPGERALRHNFPRRNRIIAALSRAVVVVEASEKSGALITVEHALDLGREVFAVPGAIDRPQSAGTNALLRDGAQIVAHPDDVAHVLGLSDPAAGAAGHGGESATVERAARPPEMLPAACGEDARSVWEALDLDPRYVDEVARRARLNASRVLAALSALEVAGFAVQHAGKRYARAPTFAPART